MIREESEHDESPTEKHTAMFIALLKGTVSVAAVTPAVELPSYLLRPQLVWFLQNPKRILWRF